MIKRTHEEFMKEFEEKQLKLFKEIEILSEYETKKIHLRVMTRFGECLVQPSYLLYGTSPTILTAVNKTEYFKNVLLNKYPNIFEEIKILVGKLVLIQVVKNSMIIKSI